MKVIYFNTQLDSSPCRIKLNGILRYAKARGWQVEVVDERKTSARSIASRLGRGRPDGCIVEACRLGKGISPSVFGTTPVVFLDVNGRLFRGRMAAVVHDYAATCKLAMEELLSTNPRSLAYVGWTLDAFWSRLREREFSSLAALRGLPYCRFTHLLAEQGEARYQQALRKWISELPSGCAIFAANDKVAARVLAACKAVGRLIPEDLVLLGVDYDPSVCDASVPMLSSVRLDFEMAGYRSAELLDALIAGAVRTPVRETFGPLCVIRSESTRRRPRRVGAILDAMSLIREQACDGLDVDAVVSVMKMPRRTAELRFREIMGTSIAGEIGKIRMQRVTQLLSDGTVPIGEIAGRCGYRTGQALRKSFHAWTGKSLREWRQDAVANGFEPGGTGK